MKAILNKAKAFSAELLELNLKNKLEERGKKKLDKLEETEKLKEKTQKKLEETA